MPSPRSRLQRRKRGHKSKPAALAARKRNAKRVKIPSNDRFEIAFGFLREGRSQRRSAQIAGISVNRFSRFLRSNKLANFKNGRWLITDRREREVAVISEGREYIVKVRGFRAASLTMRHRAAVHSFLESNDAALLKPFEGLAVTDTAKQKHTLETRPNVLLRLANAGGDADMKIYRLID